MITPPFAVFVGAGGKKQKANQLEAKFPILVLAKLGDTILIDHVRGEVVRLRKEPRTGTAALDVRLRLGRFLDVPALEIMDDGKVEREPYVAGQSFLKADSHARIRAASVLLRQYVELTMEERRPAPALFWDRVAGYARSLPLPESASLWVKAVAGSWPSYLPFTPAHGDLSGFNILLRKESPSLIDLEECDWLPAYYDFFFLNHKELLAGRPELWRYFITGEGWSTVAGALRNSGAMSEGIDKTEWLVSAFFLECFLWGRKQGARPLDEETLLRWWTPISTDSSSPC